ncbi:MAG: hypothetical protein C4519_24460 [Desulfobacteraceae bacterium]|nr:MAG: hypothetical protein C4519_24460 [Desulfobacteraceae bacterium]
MAQMQFDEFIKQGKEQYEGLAKQETKLKDDLEKIKRQMATLKPMLTEAGIIQRQTRAKKKAPTE